MDRSASERICRSGYNDRAASHEAIARSIQALFATGVARFYPTAGDRADLVKFRLEADAARIETLSTWRAGREVYRNKASAPR